MTRTTKVLAAALAAAACGSPRALDPAPSPAARPSILLVTLDTTRADAVGPEAKDVETPAFDAVAARGRRFRRAYAAVPETLPSHASMMTGLLSRRPRRPPERAAPGPRPCPSWPSGCKAAGYSTAAFVSAFVLARRFGLARGFDVYDDALPAGGARSGRPRTRPIARWRTSRRRRPARASCGSTSSIPHAPYAPPEPFRARYRDRPYLGEVAAMDAQLARVVDAFARSARGPVAIVIAGDHGEGLGEHGERQHGDLLYEATMRVPLVLAGPGVAPGVTDEPVSIRRIFHTVLDWAGIDAAGSLRAPAPEVVVGEAMRPFLSYGWQPQVMAVQGPHKAIRAGRLEAYDVVADPAESRDLGAAAPLSRALRDALRDYPLPSLGRPACVRGARRRRRRSSWPASATSRARRRARRPRRRAAAGGPDGAAGAARAGGGPVRGGEVRGRHPPAAADRGRGSRQPRRLRCASPPRTRRWGRTRGRRRRSRRRRGSLPAPKTCGPIARCTTRGARSGPGRSPLLERIVAESPQRLPALEALAVIRERQGRPEDAVGPAAEDLRAARPLARRRAWRWASWPCSAGRTADAIEALEKARAAQGAAFSHDLELGVLYLAARRFAEARDALDRVPASHPGYPMALFKRAQVSVLLGEPDRAARIAGARVSGRMQPPAR